MRSWSAEGPKDDLRVLFVGLYYRGQRREDLERKYFEVYHPIDERVPRLRQLPDPWAPAARCPAPAKRRRWRKLHLGLDLASGAIVCAALTHDNVGDSTALPGLLDQLDAPVTGFLADGAYDGASTRNLLRQRYGETLDVVIPPPKDRSEYILQQSGRYPFYAMSRSRGRTRVQARRREGSNGSTGPGSSAE